MEAEVSTPCPSQSAPLQQEDPGPLARGTDHTMRSISFTEMVSLAILNSDRHPLTLCIKLEEVDLDEMCIPPVGENIFFHLLLHIEDATTAPTIYLHLENN